MTVDLKVLNIYDVAYYDTHVIDFNPQLHHFRKLKDLSFKYLNALIQEGHHSSIIDARACLALFLKLKSVMAIEIDGPSFLLQGVGPTKRRSHRLTESKLFHRQAFKCLDGQDRAEPSPSQVSQPPKFEMKATNFELFEKTFTAIEPDRKYKINQKKVQQ